jgi:hypothetical protein
MQMHGGGFTHPPYSRWDIVRHPSLRQAGKKGKERQKDFIFCLIIGVLI